MLTQTELKLLIDGCEAYLAGNDDHENGFCYWFQQWLQRNGEATQGDSRGYDIVENFDISTWLGPGLSDYVDSTKGRTEAREQFVRELHEAACFRAEGSVMKLFTVFGAANYAGGLYLVAAKSSEDAVELARQWIKDDSEYNPIHVSSATEVGTCRGRARVVDAYQYIE